MTDAFSIRDAEAADAPRLSAINDAGAPGVGPATEAELAALTAQAAATLVARETPLVARETPVVDGDAAAILGFLLILGPGAAYASPNYAWFHARHGAAPFLYVDRIAVVEAGRGRGVGAALYRAAFARFAGAGPLGCEVNTVPPNPGSARFHARLGFREVGAQTFVPGEKAVVYLERDL